MTGEPSAAAVAARAALEAAFPGVLREGGLDAAELAARLDVEVLPGTGPQRYGLDWIGRDAALRAAEAPGGEFVLDQDRSINPLSACDLFFEGDSLAALQQLQAQYAGQVKLSYIDPPYNTGNGFVYEDRFRLRRSDELLATPAAATVDEAGLRHSAWLNLLYPRLVLAHRLLAPDGVIAVSIDANEVAQLRLVLDEIFGSQNFLNELIWVSNLKGRQIGVGGAVGTHEYVLCYAKDVSRVGRFRGSFQELKAMMPSVYKGAGYPTKRDQLGEYLTKNELHNTNSKFNEVSAPTMVYRIHYHPGTGEVRVSDLDDPDTFPGFLTALPHPNARPDRAWHAWRWSRARVLADSANLEFQVKGDRLRIWTKVRDIDGVAIKDLILGPSTRTGQEDLAALGLGRSFDNPKPVALIRLLVAATTSGEDVVLDFFAGSGTTAQAVAEQNTADGGRRRCILVNIPAATPPNSEARRLGFETISEITLARLAALSNTARAAGWSGVRVLSQRKPSEAGWADD